MDGSQLIGRASELAVLTDAVADAAAGIGRAVVVSGEAGSGKTTLLDTVAARASDVFRTLRIAGHPAETCLPNAGVDQLLRATGLEDPLPAAASDPLLAAAALLRRITDLARDVPTLIIVDDAQWLDPASRSSLVFVARRIDADAVCVIFAARSPHHGEVSVGASVDLTPLTDDESRALLRSHFPAMSSRVATRMSAHCHGLPLALAEIPAELSESQMRGADPLPADLPLGRSLTRVFAKRLEGLSSRARRALLAGAFDPVSATTYRAVLDDLGCALSDLDAAERLGLVRVATGRCDFRHPLVASAVRDQASTRDLAQVHRALASVFDDPAREALHVARDIHAQPADRAAAARVAAEATYRARDYGSAADLWRTSAELTDDPDEARRCLRHALACHARSGDGPEARALIDRLLPQVENVRDRADLVRDHIVFSLWSRSTLPDGHESLELEAVGWLRSGDEPTREAGVEVLTALATAALGEEDYARAQRISTTLNEHAPDRLTLEQRLLCDVAAAQVGMPGAGRLLRGQWVDEYPWHRVHDPASPIGFITATLAWLDGFELLDVVIDRCRGAMSDDGWSICARYIVDSITLNQEQHRGRWDHALSAYEALERLVIDTDFAGPFPYLALRHAHLHAARGSAEVCERVRGRAREVASAWVPGLAHLDHAVAGLLALSQREYRAALSELDAAAEIERRIGLVPSGYLSRLPDTFEAAWRLGLGEADARLDDLVEFEEAMRAMKHRPMLGMAARCRALVASADEMDAAFAEAVSLLEPAPNGYEVARTNLLWGERRRRARRKAAARERLALARDAFARLGAVAWVEQCDAELAACGVRRVREVATGNDALSSLTPREFEVAREIAPGRTNAEAAHRLFVSERTVEFHLGNVFRKLQISGREGLAAVLFAEDG